MAPLPGKISFSFLWYLVILLVIVAGFYFYTRTTDSGLAPGISPELKQAALEYPVPETKKQFAGKTEPTVVKEELQIPKVKRVSVTSGRAVEGSETRVETPLVPMTEGEKVIVPLAVYTVKGAYELALKEALSWKSDAKPSFVKSSGAVTVDGKSSQWQVAYVSASASKKSYVVVIQGDAVVSKQEVDSTAVGASLPKTWYDSDEALKRLAELPQFVNATISVIQFFYNADAKVWRYVIQTSSGTTSLEL